MTYRALGNLTSRATGRTYAAGEQVPLDHLSADEIQALIKAGAIEEIPAKPQPEPAAPTAEAEATPEEAAPAGETPAEAADQPRRRR